MDETTRHNICMGLKVIMVVLMVMILLRLNNLEAINERVRVLEEHSRNINRIMSNAAADIKPLADMAKLALAGGPPSQ